MKILHLKLNSRQSAAREAYSEPDFSLLFFKAPIIADINGNETALSGSSAVILSGGSRFRFSSPAGKKIRFDKVNFKMSLADVQFLSYIGLPTDTPIRLRDDFIVSSAIRSLNIRMLEQSRFSEEFSEHAMKMIFIALSDAYNQKETAPKNTIPRYAELKELRNLIYEKPEISWSVDEISSKMGISRVYFHRIYSEAFGTSCLRDIIESRLMRACVLLSTTSLSVSMIAERCGYENDSYFMRQFKKYKNCTPSEYRNRCISAGKK